MRSSISANAEAQARGRRLHEVDFALPQASPHLLICSDELCKADRGQRAAPLPRPHVMNTHKDRFQRGTYLSLSTFNFSHVH